MIVKLNETIEISELAEMHVSGCNESDGELYIEIAFTKEALIGFATNLLWMYEDITPNKKVHLHIDPLSDTRAGNQALGFFLTPSSPAMVIQVNGKDLGNISQYQIFGRYNEIPIKYPFIKTFEVKEPAEDESIEEYELGFNNLADVKIFGSDKTKISNERIQLIFNLNYDGLKDFATKLLVLANCYETNLSYVAACANHNGEQYNMGVLFTGNGQNIKFKCAYLGCVNDYASEFGNINI